MFPLRSGPMPNRRWEQAHDGDYSCCMSPLREPMPSEPSRTDEMDEEGSVTAGAAGDSATTGGSSNVWSWVTFSKNVADGTKNRLPVTARLKSRSRSYLPGGRPTNMFSSICSMVRGERL